MENDKKMVLRDVSPSGEEIKKEIRELTEEEVKGHKLLGKAFGVNFGHCMYIAHRHCQNFRSRVVGYRIVKNDEIAAMFEKSMNLEYMAVEFFEAL